MVANGFNRGVTGLNIVGMHGLGDNIYQRAFIKAIDGTVYLQTPWPELYKDLSNVRAVKPATTLRTQSKNIRNYTQWHAMPLGNTRQISYGKLGIINGMTRAFGHGPANFDLPDFGQSPIAGYYVVVRPVSVRKEWRADSRNPLPEYIDQAAKKFKPMGVKVVSVADLEDGHEWLVGDAPYADVRYHGGELGVSELMALFAGAKAVVGGIGWILPACIATKTQALIVCGGQGGFNSPASLVDTERMDLKNITFATPQNQCMCYSKDHKCNKTIINYSLTLNDWARKIQVQLK